MADNTNTSVKPTLVTIPHELRVEVYENVSDYDPIKTPDHKRYAAVSLEAIKRRCAPLAHLSQTCKKVHDDVDHFLYKTTRFMITIHNICTEDVLAKGLNLSVFSTLRYLEVWFVVVPPYGWVIHNDVLAKIIRLLGESMELQDLKITVSISDDVFREGKRRELGVKVEDLKKIAVEEGAALGKDPNEVEVDFGFKVGEMFKRLTWPDLEVDG